MEIRYFGNNLQKISETDFFENGTPTFKSFQSNFFYFKFRSVNFFTIGRPLK